MRYPRWIPPLLYGIIFTTATIGGFIYTDRYSGWGHYHANAVPVGLGLGAVVTFIAAIVVSEMDERRTLWTLAAGALVSATGCGLIVWQAP